MAIRAEVVHVVRRELARKIEDVLVRRLHLLYETRDRGAAAIEQVADLMKNELGWSAEETRQRVDDYRAALA